MREGCDKYNVVWASMKHRWKKKKRLSGNFKITLAREGWKE